MFIFTFHEVLTSYLAYDRTMLHCHFLHAIELEQLVLRTYKLLGVQRYGEPSYAYLAWFKKGSDVFCAKHPWAVPAKDVQPLFEPTGYAIIPDCAPRPPKHRNLTLTSHSTDSSKWLHIDSR